MEESFDLGFVVIGELGGLFFEEFGRDGLKLDLEGGFEFLGVGEVAGGEGFALDEALLGGGELSGGGGAGGGEVGGELSVERGELSEVRVGGGELGGEAGLIGAGGAQFCGVNGGAAAQKKPGKRATDSGCDKGEKGKKHVKHSRCGVHANQCRMHFLTGHFTASKQPRCFSARAGYTLKFLPFSLYADRKFSLRSGGDFG
jgi:hypothetical protein